MRFEAFEKAALALPGVKLDIKWGKDRVFCVGDKMFAVAGEVGDDLPLYAMKASDTSFEMLIEEGVAEPAPYLARARWVKFTSADAVPDDQLLAYLKQAHQLIAAKLTKKQRSELGIA